MGAKRERTAIVTGGGKRIGAGLVEALLADDWTVVAHVHRPDDSVPQGAVRVVAELGGAEGGEAIFAAGEGLPPIRLLVNNAGRFAFDSFDSFNRAEFDAHMAANVLGPAELIRRFAERQEAGDDSLVVNILDAKLAAPNPDFLSYTLSKQALAGLTDLAARAFAERGVRVNGIAPALVLRSPGQTESNFEAMHRANPLRRGVGIEDIAGAVRYFISAPCVTGQVLVLDSGQRFLGLGRDVQFLENI